MNVKKSAAFNLILGLVFWILVSPGVEAASKYVFSAVPQFTPPQVFKEWQPLLKQLTADTGIVFELRTFESIPQFEEAFYKGTIDLAFMNPYHAVMARKAQGYIPLVRDEDQLIGILLVRNEGPKKIEELNGKVLGFPAPNSFGASLYMRALLKEQHGLKFESRWLNTHSNVYRHVIAGEVLAGGSVQRALDTEPKALRSQLRVLFETPVAAPHPLSAHPRVTASDRAKLQDALLKYRTMNDKRPLLKTVRMNNIVKADYARDYQPLEKLRLEKYIGGKE